MIGTLRRHQKWLWYTVIAAMSVGLVTYFSPTSRYGRSTGSFSSSGPELGKVNGEPITPEQLIAAQREASIFMRLRLGVWPSTEDQKKQLLQLAQQSLVIESLLKDYKINVTTDAAARFTKKMFGVPPNQSMPADKFNQWIQDEVMRKGGLSLEDFDRFIRHQAGQEYLMSLAGITGELITPKEAGFFYQRENEPMVTEIVFFPISKFYADTPPTEAELQDYFTNHQTQYRLPDRIQINYAAFDPSNYFAKADQALGTNVNDKVDEYYRSQPPEAFKGESNQTLNATEAHALIKKRLRESAAFQEAGKAANAFLNDLSEGHNETHPYAPSDLAKLAKSKGLTVKTTGLFDELNGCKDLDLSPKALHVLFSLRDDAPDDPEKSMLYAPSPLRNEDGTAIYVAGLQKRDPSQLQTLAQVHDQVLKDYRQSKAVALARDTGEKFATALQAGLTQGKSFDAVCEAQNLKPESLPPFAVSTTNVPPGLDRSSFQQLQESLFTLSPGQISRFIPTTDGGLIAHMKSRMPLDEARMRQEFPMYLERMREQRQTAAFQQWLGRQMQLRWIPPPSSQTGPG